MDTMTDLDRLYALADRFAGIRLQCQRVQPREWPEPCRAELFVTKNERAEYRLTTYGATFSQAAQALLRAVEAIDNRGSS